MIRPLPVYFNHPVFSLSGTMLFPDNELMAQAYVALRLGRSAGDRAGILGRYRRTGWSGWGEEMQSQYDHIVGLNLLSEAKIASAMRAGRCVGRLAVVLYAMILADPSTASWTEAANWVEARTPAANRIARTTAAGKRTKLSPVIHLWGIWFLRECDGRGGFELEELNGFLGEAAQLMHELRLWSESLVYYRHNGMPSLDVDEFGSGRPHPLVALRVPTLSESV